MKELYATGQMHNRVRMISASFLVKDLLINWRAGEEYFWDTLVDACPAVNPFSWQWVFGSGYDAAPYFRIFNPDTQRERFDPNFEYCKKWLGKNFALGGDARIVSHEIQRDKANRLYTLIK
jgi:deoxyribodipyrimidine photo-lyase